MKNKTISIINQLDYFKWGACLFALSFYFGVAANSIGFALFILCGVLNFLLNYKTLPKLVLKEKMGLILVLFFAVIFSREVSSGQIELDNILIPNATFLVLPFIFQVNYLRIKSIYPFVLKAFVIGSVISIIVNLSFAVYRGIIQVKSTINFWYFTYDFLSEPFGIQPIYLACFYVFAILILIDRKVFKYSILNYLLFLFLLLGIFLLAARNAILSLFVIMPVFYVIKNGFRWKKLLWIFLSFILLAFFALQNPVVKNRVLKFNQKGNFYSGSSLRLGIWNSGVAASKNNMLFGSGVVEGNRLLWEQFRKNELAIPFQKKYHTHNQYLQTLLHYGLVGLAVLVYTLLLFVVLMYRRKNYLALSWIVLFILASVTESLLVRQWGVYFFVFFLLLFVYGDEDPQLYKNTKGYLDPI